MPGDAQTLYSITPAKPKPPPPPMPWQVPPPVQEELDHLRLTVETQARTIKYLLANYEGLLSKIEAEGIDIKPGVVPTFGPPQAFAIGAVIAAGQWVVTAAGSITLAPVLGQVVEVPTQGAATAATAITLMPIT